MEPLEHFEQLILANGKFEEEFGTLHKPPRAIVEREALVEGQKKPRSPTTGVFDFIADSALNYISQP